VIVFPVCRAQEGGHLRGGDCGRGLQDAGLEGAHQQVLWQRAEHHAERRRGGGPGLCPAGEPGH